MNKLIEMELWIEDVINVQDFIEFYHNMIQKDINFLLPFQKEIEKYQNCNKTTNLEFIISTEKDWINYEDELLVLSKKFPNNLFTLVYTGTERFNCWQQYFLNEKTYKEYLVIYNPSHFEYSKLR